MPVANQSDMPLSLDEELMEAKFGFPLLSIYYTILHMQSQPTSAQLSSEKNDIRRGKKKHNLEDGFP